MWLEINRNVTIFQALLPHTTCPFSVFSSFQPHQPLSNRRFFRSSLSFSITQRYARENRDKRGRRWLRVQGSGKKRGENTEGKKVEQNSKSDGRPLCTYLGDETSGKSRKRIVCVRTIRGLYCMYIPGRRIVTSPRDRPTRREGGSFRVHICELIRA